MCVHRLQAFLLRLARSASRANSKAMAVLALEELPTPASEASGVSALCFPVRGSSFKRGYQGASPELVSRRVLPLVGCRYKAVLGIRAKDFIGLEVGRKDPLIAVGFSSSHDVYF